MALTYKQKFNKKHKQPLNKSNSLDEISKLSGVKKSILQDVRDRGYGAWRTNIASVRLKSGKKDYKAPRSAKMTKEQWAFGRIYSFIGGGTTQKMSDSDLWKKHLQKKS